MNNFGLYLLVMAGVTYLIRMLPFVLFKKKITNRFVVSFLYYLPYAVLSVMTVPAVFFVTENIISCVIGFVVSLILAYFGRGLMFVAIGSCVGVFVSEIILQFLA